MKKSLVRWLWIFRFKQYYRKARKDTTISIIQFMKNTNKNTTIPWLSIIIPIYNAEEYLETCFKSIIKQDYINFEVLMIDDGSTDNSANICKKYEKMDYRFKYFFFENGGSYSARIQGINLMNGSYFTFCDADDYYSSNNAFSTMFELINRYKVEVLEFSYIKKYNHLHSKNRCSDKLLLVDQEKFLTHEYPLLLCSQWEGAHINNLTWNKVYASNLKNKILFTDIRIFWGDDQILNLQLLENCKSILIVPNILYCYRQQTGYTNKFSKNALNDLNTIKECQLYFIKNYKHDNKDLMYRNLYGEIAGWTFAYMKNALEVLDEKEVFRIMNLSLELSTFKLAREYYLTTNNENWNGVNLIRSKDINKYLVIAKEENKNQKFKNVIKNIIKKMI